MHQLDVEHPALSGTLGWIYDLCLYDYKSCHQVPPTVLKVIGNDTRLYTLLAATNALLHPLSIQIQLAQGLKAITK